MIQFLYEGKTYVTVKVEGLPATIIKVAEEKPSNDSLLALCQEWVKALGLKDREWHLDLRLH